MTLVITQSQTFCVGPFGEKSEKSDGTLDVWIEKKTSLQSEFHVLCFILFCVVLKEKKPLSIQSHYSNFFFVMMTEIRINFL